MSTSAERMRRMRARIAEAKAGGTEGRATMRDADDLLWPAVRETLAALDVQDEDAAAVRLALRYAKTIDDHEDRAWAVRWIGPLLLDALEQLGATPAARARLKTGRTADAPVGQLARLRAARRA